MKGGRLCFAWRGLYSSPFRETLRDRKSREGPPPVLPLKGVFSIPLLPKSMYCSHAQRGFHQGLAASWPFASGRPGGGRGEGARPQKKKKIEYRFFFSFLFFGWAHPSKLQGPVALCLLSPLIWPLLLPY